MIEAGGAFLAGVALGPLVDGWITAQLARNGLGRGDGWRPATKWMLSVAMGVGWAIALRSLGWLFVLPAHLLWVVLTSALVMTDLEHKLIPNRILYPGTGITAVLLAIGSLLDQTPGRLAGALSGAALCLVGMGLLGALGRGALGMGDVKLSALLGLVCGFQEAWLALWGILTGFLIGGAAAGVVVAAGRASRHTRIPFAPALVAGSWWCLFAGFF